MSDSGDNGPGRGGLVLKLYVHGDSPRTERAVRRLQQICQARDDCQAEVIDLSRHPELAGTERILATPALVKESPSPRRRIVGDLSDTAAVLALLDLDDPIHGGTNGG